MAANTKSKTSEQKQKTTEPEKIETPAPVPEETPEKPVVAKEIDPSQYVSVRNGFHGKLVYISPRTGESFEWDEYDDEQDMELRELKTAKAGAKMFFSENWFKLDDWVIRYLGVENFYKHAKSMEEFDEMFRMDPDALRSEIAEMSESQKNSMAYRAKELIADGRLDSLRMIGVLEDALGIELIEK